MTGAASSVKILGHSYDPLAALAEAIGSLLVLDPGKKPGAGKTLSFQVASALHRVLNARTPQSRGARMLLIRHLVEIESQDAGIDMPDKRSTADDLISTAQAAEILGYSRPYVAMLIDQNKLKGATVSAGGHRRVSRAAVLEWKDKHQVSGKTVDLRTTGRKIGAYKSSEADAVRRVKALASSRM